MTEHHSGNPRVRLGVSACLLGQPVRFDGGHKRDAFLTGALAPFVQFVAVCPEEEAGLGTPREAIRLVDEAGVRRLVAVRSRRDFTDSLSEAAARRVRQLPALDLDGYVLKKDSPSCGLTRVKVYSPHGVATRTGRGVFAQALAAAMPLLPVEEEGRLCDPVIREHFIERIYASRRLRQLLAGPARVGDLVQFHARHKLQLLAHAPASGAALGRLVAHARVRDGEQAAAEYGRAFMAVLARPATRARHVNVLQHAAGYFRRVLSAAARRDVAASISEYRHGLVPLVVPTRLLDHYARLHDMDYLCDQVYFDPYPRELLLRNQV
jgi:uncharacterized protein YbgA (DUF1722 family)/uncharacterized protein YbbK (DUF523 family)